MKQQRFKRKDGSLTHEHFQLREFIQTAQLRNQGLTDEEIVAKAKSDNLYQFPTTSQAATMAWGMLNRLDSLQDEALTSLVAQGAVEQAAQVNLYAMMRIYPVVEAFMVEEIGQRFSTLNYTLEPLDMNAFLTRYRTQDDQASAWSDATAKRIRSVLTELLVKAGYLSDRTSTELQCVFTDPALKDAMCSNGDTAWLPAFNCLEVL